MNSIGNTTLLDEYTINIKTDYYNNKSSELSDIFKNTYYAMGYIAATLEYNKISYIESGDFMESSNIKQDIKETEDRLVKRIDRFEDKIDERFDKLDNKLDDKFDKLHNEIANNSKEVSNQYINLINELHKASEDTNKKIELLKDDIHKNAVSNMKFWIGIAIPSIFSIASLFVNFLKK